MTPQPGRLPVWIPTFLGALFLVLCAGLLYHHGTAIKEKSRNTASITHFSNQWVRCAEKLKEQKSVNVSLECELDAQSEELKSCSNKLVTLSATLSESRAKAKAADDTAKEQVRTQDTRIAELESERDGMSKKMDGLTASISKLETQIAETEQKLQSSKGEREFLVKELKRLQTEKAQLEKQFYDLAVLREQVRKLRAELAINRRLDWIRRGLYGSLKGGEVLRKGFTTAAAAPSAFNLDVEVHRDGPAKVLPSLDHP
jgi:chromosome segregation ATPase